MSPPTAGAVGAVVCNAPNNQSQYRVTVTHAVGGMAFADAELFVAAVDQMARPTGQVTDLDEGPLADVVTD
ncbi:hypothetical protein J0H58_22395 [bacterium]|nr:hypothetical protein [bacterium]